MQRRGSTFIGCIIEATDGDAGRITDILFEDNSWALRWFVVDTGSWTTGQQILMHPSALEPPDMVARTFLVNLSRAQIEAGPKLRSDEPVSRQMDHELGGGDGSSPTWGGYYGGDAFGMAGESWQNENGMISNAAAVDGDAHLRSLSEVKGYNIHALDGKIGHLTDLLIDDESWKIDCALVDTKNWWPGKHVLLTAESMVEINWAGRYVRVDQTCFKIKSSLPWTEADRSETTTP